MTIEKRELLPRLRFPEFESAGSWKERELSQISKPVTKRANASEENRALTLSNEHGLVLQSEYFGKKIAGENVERYTSISANDFVYNDRITSSSPYGTIKRLHLYESGIVSPIYKCFRFYEPEGARFWEYYFESGIHDFQIKGLVNEGARAGRYNISIDKFLSTLVWQPSLPEQTRIAACLSSLDALITAQGQKLEALQEHKRGLMQKLFPTEGQRVPKFRFSEFQWAGNWTEVDLGDIAEIKLGKMLDKNKNNSGILLPYLNNLAVRWNEINTEGLPQMYFENHELDRFGLKAGDVVVCEGGEPGRAAVWDGRLPELKFQKAIHRVRFNVPYEPRFFVIYLESLNGKAKFEMLFTGGGIKHLTQETFVKLTVPLISLSEQKRIADFFSSLDNLIVAQQEKIAELKSFKQGLMQGLFPAVKD